MEAIPIPGPDAIPRVLLRASLAALAALAACGAPQRPVRTDAELDAARTAHIEREDRTYERLLASMSRRMVANARNAAPGRATYDVLVLHGGGANFSFSAGVLLGWGEVEDPEHDRPVFDLVTGSSSGSLIALYAYGGHDEDWADLHRAVTDPPRLGQPGLLSLWPSRASALDSGPLADRLDEVLDGRRLDRLAERYAEDRTLLVQTTDLDLGLGRVFDLGLEATQARDQGSGRRVRDIVMASTALPLAFPPVELDGSIYGDGGISFSLFLGFGAAAVADIVDDWAVEYPELPMPRVRIWVVLCQQLFAPARTVRTRWPDIAMRSLDLMMQYDRFKAMYLVNAFVERVNELEGMEAELRYVAIPLDAQLPTDLAHLSDPETSRALLEVGRRVGAEPSSWQEGAPDAFHMPDPTPSVEGGADAGSQLTPSR